MHMPLLFITVFSSDCPFHLGSHSDCESVQMHLLTDRIDGVLTIPFFLCKGKIFLRPILVSEFADAERVIPART